ncbi:MAG: hypothetical protein M1817_001902 [Caeruleum heppii]|nr:MAG: hypothetical protein M1817_001902 [Caeruleum heppii]
MPARSPALLPLPVQLLLALVVIAGTSYLHDVPRHWSRSRPELRALAVRQMPRRSLNSVWPTPSPNSAAFNALLYGYVGTKSSMTSTYTPPTIMWWDDERVDSTVTTDFIASKLRAEERTLLHRPLAFGAGLTDDTYAEWILEKSKRLFLILTDIGVPEQIFGVSDDSWDDEDLPISMEAVDRLQLSYEKDEALNQKFYKRQFAYLMQDISQGEHRNFNHDETVPLEPVTKRPGVTFLHSSEKVHLPGRPDQVFLRKRVVFGQGASQILQSEFRTTVETIRSISHEHIVSIWASYTFEGCGYVLCTPSTELTLRNFLQVPPPHFRNFPKPKRRQIVLNWLHCLADALSYLHSQGMSHGNIRPSSVMIDSAENIYLGDVAAFDQMLADKRPNALECYDYGAPEKWLRAKVKESTRSKTPEVNPRSFLAKTSMYSSTVSRSPSSASKRASEGELAVRKPTTPVLSEWRAAISDPQQADIFSLGCIFLEILTMLLKQKGTSFSSHRSTKNRTPGRGGGRPDTSFHANLGQVESWIELLEKRAEKKVDNIMRGVQPILSLCGCMLARDPISRPSAKQVEETLYDILVGPCGLRVLHCGDYSGGSTSLDYEYLGNTDSASVATKQSSNSSSSLTTIKVKDKGWYLPAPAGYEQQ